MNSLEYWDRRWSADGSFHASWPDTFARMLELNFIYKSIQKAEDRRFGSTADRLESVLELGCGPLSLDENVCLAFYIRERDFVGIDGSEAAVRVARARLPGAKFLVADLENLDLEWPKADLLICRRTLQNLAPAHRGRLLARLADYPNGVLIEGTLSGLQATNTVRADHGLGPLAAPEFNEYLCAAEETTILKLPGCRKVSFLDKYYEQTRGVRQLVGWNTENHLAAYEAQLAAPEVAEGLGPVQGFAWSS